MSTIPKAAIEAVARRINPEAWREIPPDDAPENWEEISSALRQRSMDRAEQYILAALPHMGEPVAHLVWLQGVRAADDIEDYYEVARPGDKSADGSGPFPVYRAPTAATIAIRTLQWDESGRADIYEVGPADWRGKPQAYWSKKVDGSPWIAGFAPTIDAAKAAAQADYEARIRSALVAAPPVDEVKEKMAEALKKALNTMENVDGENDCRRAIASVEEALSAYEAEKASKEESR